MTSSDSEYVSHNDVAEVQRLAQLAGVGDVIYDDATEAEELKTIFNELGHEVDLNDNYRTS